MIPVDEVCYFQARDKYTAVVTADGEYLIRRPGRELAAELDPAAFWQIHRITVVNAWCIAQLSRAAGGRRLLRLTNRPEILAVSRAHGDRFRQM